MARLGAAWLPGPTTETLRRWLSRAFILSILAYLIVIGYLLAESVTGASRWAPYGVNVPVFIALIIASEVIITLTAVWIFREDAGIWPESIADGWAMVRRGAVVSGLRTIVVGAWDVPLIDLRLRTPRAIFLGRANRIAALVPLAYALIASAGGAPWGLRSSALFDVVITLVVWAFMEVVMVRPGSAAPTAAATVPESLQADGDGVPEPYRKRTAKAPRESRYEVRRVTTEDVARIEEIERIRWKDQAATREQIISRIETFPEGQIGVDHVRVDADGRTERKLVGWGTFMLADEERLHSTPSWQEVTADGSIRSHDPRGTVVIGVNIASVTEGGIHFLMGEILASTVEWNKAKLIGACRLNGFAAFNRRRTSRGRQPLTADQYARLREIRGEHINEERIDAGLPPLPDDEYLREVAARRTREGGPPLRADERPGYVCSNMREYLSIPGSRLLAVVPDYFPDPASHDYGVVIDWPNPVPPLVRSIPPVRQWVADRVRREVRAEWEEQKARKREAARRRAAERVPEYLQAGSASGSEDGVTTGDRRR